MYNYFISFALINNKNGGGIALGRVHLQLDHKIIDPEDIEQLQGEIERQANNLYTYYLSNTTISIVNIVFLGKKTKKS
jgi:hypothetical protein